MTSRRRPKGTSRQELVLDAAGRAIAELGLTHVRVADVAERAGMTTGHVTYYYPSKNDLLLQAIRRSEAAHTAQVGVELAAIDDPWQRLERLLRLSAAEAVGDPGWVLWLHVWSTAADDPEVARVHDQLDAAWRSILLDVVEHGCRRGVFVAADPAAVTEQLSALLDGLSIQLTLGSPGMTPDRLRQLALATARALLAPG